MFRKMCFCLSWLMMTAPAWAADTKAAPGSYAALRQEFMDAQKKFQAEKQKEATEKFEAMKRQVAAAEKELKEAKTEEEIKAAKEKLKKASLMSVMGVQMIGAGDGPGKLFSPRFLEFGIKNPNDPDACEALLMALRTSDARTGKNNVTLNTVCGELLKNHAKKPEIKRALGELSSFGEAVADKVIDEVIANHPNRKIRAIAVRSVAEAREQAAQTGTLLKDRPDFRKNFEGFRGKEFADDLMAKVDTNKAESVRLRKILADQYADVLPDLSIGKTAPEVVSKNLDGKPVRLSELRGRVVVLDIWATWCGPCKAMIPHEREMVGKLKDKPFTLVSVSADEELDTIKDFLTTTEMPWSHWWNGKEGGILEDWDVRYFPTIYVLDAKGVIRHKDLREKKLEEAVEELLKEAESKK